MCRVLVVSREFDGKDRMERMAVVIYALLKGTPSQCCTHQNTKPRQYKVGSDMKTQTYTRQEACCAEAVDHCCQSHADDVPWQFLISTDASLLSALCHTGLHTPERLPPGGSAFASADRRRMRGFSGAVGDRVMALPIFRDLSVLGKTTRHMDNPNMSDNTSHRLCRHACPSKRCIPWIALVHKRFFK